jgi:hypothetical protein
MANTGMPVPSDHLFHCHKLVTASLLVPVGQDRKPRQNSPNAILLSNVVRTCKTKQFYIRPLPTLKHSKPSPSAKQIMQILTHKSSHSKPSELEEKDSKLQVNLSDTMHLSLPCKIDLK